MVQTSSRARFAGEDVRIINGLQKLSLKNWKSIEKNTRCGYRLFIYTYAFYMAMNKFIIDELCLSTRTIKYLNIVDDETKKR